MARPIKNGLDYFPLDVHIFEDEKIEALAGDFGIKGELAVIKLLCAVYEKGYFIVWNDLTKAKLLKRLPTVSKELLDQIVDRLVMWEFFNEDLFNSAKVLTSEKIQATYFEAIKRRKIAKPTQYLVNANINEVNVNNNSSTDKVNANINKQIKEKEIKLKETNKNTKPKSTRTYDSDDPNYKLAEYLFEKIRERQPDFKKPNLQKWANDIRLTNEIDKRTYEQIKNMIDWSQADSFWQANILSTGKLRTKYDQMRAKALSESNIPSTRIEKGTDWEKVEAEQTSNANDEVTASNIEEAKRMLQQLRSGEDG